MNPGMQIDEVYLQILLVLLPRHSVYARCRIPFEPGKGLSEQFDIDVMEYSGELFLLPCLCYLPYTVKPPGTRFPGSVSVTCGSLPRSPRSSPFAPSTPLMVAHLCSSTSQLLWRGLTSPDHVSSATAPRLPDAGHPIGRVVNQEISRFPNKERTRMPGSTTTQGRTGTRSNAPVRITFRRPNNVGTLK